MNGQDLRSVLRLFAEIASSLDRDEGARTPDGHDSEQGAEDLSGARSSTEGAKYGVTGDGARREAEEGPQASLRI